MTVNNLIDETEKLQGNLTRGNRIYISSQNMNYFATMLNETDGKHGILLTPYLIIENGVLYELHYYEFDIEIRGDKSYYIDYNPKNSLPTEVIVNLKPQVIVAAGDKNFYCNAIKQYLTKMSKMEFEEDKDYHPELQNAQLFYQIFI